MVEDLGLNIDVFLFCVIFVIVLFVNIECEIYNNCMFIKCFLLFIINNSMIGEVLFVYVVLFVEVVFE